VVPNDPTSNRASKTYAAEIKGKWRLALKVLPKPSRLSQSPEITEVRGWRSRFRLGMQREVVCCDVVLRWFSAFALLAALDGAGGDAWAAGPEQGAPRELALTSPAPSLAVVPGPPAGDLPEPVALGGSQLIFLNRNGGVYGGDDNRQSDSRGDVTGLIPTKTVSASIPAWNQGDEAWGELVACVRSKFARFNVEITDQDPCAGAGDGCGVSHLEAVIGGRDSDFPGYEGVAGISPFTRECNPISNSIVFSFAELFPGDVEKICDVTVQEIAHSYGLDHQYLCEDPMSASYLKTHPETGDPCVNRAFMNYDSPCGETEARSCRNEVLKYDCGRDTQNSVQLLGQALGFKEDPNPPSMSIDYPSDGQTVRPGFLVFVAAEDDVAVDRVELYIDGVLAYTDPIPPYELAANDLVTDGMHDVEVRVYDASSYSVQEIQLDVDGLAASPNLIGGCQAGGDGTPLWLVVILLGWVWQRSR
jgi:uncharacterized protein (TIGR03382 family)